MFEFAKQLTALVFAAIVYCCGATAVSAQSTPDTRSPLIELEAIANTQASTSQSFTAQVVDDRQLKDVFLYHRRTGQQPFTPVVMNPRSDSGYFSATIMTDPEDLRSIEYYVQARDESGNRTVEGFAFDPYTRTLFEANPGIVIEPDAPVVPAQPTASTPSDTPEAIAQTGNIRWWHIAAGVLVVGAVAAAASGGSDSGSNDDDGGVSLTINLAEP